MKNRKHRSILLLLTGALFFAASGAAAESLSLPVENGKIKDGTYPAEISSAEPSLYDAEAELQVEDGAMTVTISLGGEECLTLDLGTLENTGETDNNASGNGVSEDFLAPEPSDPMSIDRPDGEYSIGVDLAGGSGKATVMSPTLLTIRDGKAYARIEWSSSNYDYMIVGTEKYLPVNEEGNSVFEIPVTCMDSEMAVIADTLAMGDPHEINYTLYFYSDSIGSKRQMPREAAKRVLIIALVIIIGGGILNHFVNKKRRV